MPATNVVKPTRRNQDFVEMERKINLLQESLMRPTGGRVRPKGKGMKTKRIEELTEQLSNARWTLKKKQTWLQRAMEDMALLDANNKAMNTAMSTLRRNIGGNQLVIVVCYRCMFVYIVIVLSLQ
ncbi:unnamed protein product [Cylicostephanus goldi]|uniref:Uncharacterized protein n=1 Tax=Cylicostephanus goldi TaxID=71465 RepID=A0A3P6TRI6_CYLGO|nr:unnamed protein product [Cylicostephanus goldi]